MPLTAMRTTGPEDITMVDEKSINFRNRFPENFDWDFPTLIKSATGFTIGKGAPQAIFSEAPLHSGIQQTNRQVAIIGAGVAGLCAAYELMKLGFQPIFYEMQPETKTGFVRPFGRGYSWDFTCTSSGSTIKADQGGFTSWFPTEVNGPEPVVGTNLSNFSHGRQIADLGAMRYPPSHIALHTYVDEIFEGDYYYGNIGKETDVKTITDQWPIFRDPGVFQSNASDVYGEPHDEDVLRFPTVLYTSGIFDTGVDKALRRGFYRIVETSKFGTANPALKNLVTSYWALLYGPKTIERPAGGILRTLVDKYVAYTTLVRDTPSRTVEIEQTESAIKAEWSNISNTYQAKTLYEVLRDNDWDTKKAYPPGTPSDAKSPADPSLLEMFGAIGIGSGGFDVFWWTAFTDVLRIALHEDEVDQQAFVGGTSYMLSPFLTHKVATPNKSETNLWTETKGKVISDPVVAISKGQRLRSDDVFQTIKITTRGASGIEDTKEYFACLLTASPPAIRARIAIDRDLISDAAFNGLHRIRLTNSGKIVLNFPDTGAQYSKAFWKNRDRGDPYGVQATGLSQDLIVNTITDLNIRQIYTLDNYHWGVQDLDREALTTAGTLMISYSWDMNSDSFAGLSEEEQVRAAWDQMRQIYDNALVELPDKVDEYRDWALTNKQYRALVWTDVDGMCGGYTMAGPGLYESQKTLAHEGMLGRNSDTNADTGLFLAGDSLAWLSLGGWMEGSISSALAAVCGIRTRANRLYTDDSALYPTTPVSIANGKSFSLPLLPGTVKFERTTTQASRVRAHLTR